ncbi:Bro-N domain-containing protein [Roseibium sp. MMSF_3361]|uniref:BRO-N domain-containing protein n=1 Tax=unclassified Roseibium TaxID=2629323 RepID=UPI00353258A3
MNSELSRSDLPIGRGPRPLLVAKSGVYKLIFSSDKPVARRFHNWLAKEVIPSIDKHGAYISAQKNVGTG